MCVCMCVYVHVLLLHLVLLDRMWPNPLSLSTPMGVSKEVTSNLIHSVVVDVKSKLRNLLTLLYMYAAYTIDRRIPGFEMRHVIH